MLMDEEYVWCYLVVMFVFGLMNFMCGVVVISGFDDCVVIDVGGMMVDIGLFINGFFWEMVNEVKVVGICINFWMFDVLLFGIGGGSIVDEEIVEVGFVLVGYKFMIEVLVFGGFMLIVIDIVVVVGCV